MRCVGSAISIVLFGVLLVGAGPAVRAQAPEPQRVDVPPAATTLEGIPTVRVDATQQGANRRLLDAMEREKNKLTIQKEDEIGRAHV